MNQRTYAVDLGKKRYLTIRILKIWTYQIHFALFSLKAQLLSRGNDEQERVTKQVCVIYQTCISKFPKWLWFPLPALRISFKLPNSLSFLSAHEEDSSQERKDTKKSVSLGKIRIPACVLPAAWPGSWVTWEVLLSLSLWNNHRKELLPSLVESAVQKFSCRKSTEKGKVIKSKVADKWRWSELKTTRLKYGFYVAVVWPNL